MPTETDRLNLIADPGVPALGLLLGPDSRHLLDTILAEAGGRVGTARVTQVRYVPSRSVTVQYKADVDWAGSGTTSETLVASSGVKVPDHVPVVETGTSRVAVWRFPNDPFLPGLAPAADPGKVGDVLARLGAPSADVRLRRRAYRPGRRAVIEAVTPKVRIFLKIVRPDRVQDLQSKHSELSKYVPTPHSYGWSGELGVVAMQAMPGKTLRKALESGSRRLPDPALLLRLLDSLAGAPQTTNRVSGPAERASDHARLLNSVFPDLEDRISSLVEAVSAITPEEPIVVHGDFHSSQILTKDTSVVGLIDVDTVGMGSRADDLAGLLGHISTVSLTAASRRSIERYGRELIASFDQVTAPAELRLRTAAVILGFATGPFRVQQKRWGAETERRISLAERWIDTAASIA